MRHGRSWLLTPLLYLVIFDCFRGQCTDNILSLLEQNNIQIAVVPANCTDRLQSLDASVNKALKEFLRRQFHSWYASQISTNMEIQSSTPVDIRLSVVS